MSTIADSARRATHEALARTNGLSAFETTFKRYDKVSDSTIDALCRAIEERKIIEQLASWRAEDRRGKNQGGRPPSVDDRAVLVVLIILAMQGSPLLATRGGHIVDHRLTDASRSRLNIAADPHANWKLRFWRAIHSLLALVDPYPGPRNRRLSTKEYVELLCSRDPNDQAKRQTRIDWLMNELIEVSLQLGNREMRRWRGSVSVDATPVAAYGKRGTKKSKQGKAKARKKSKLPPVADDFEHIGIEYDARWYVREGDHRPRAGTPDNKLALFGWEMTLTVMSPDDPTVYSEYPYLAVAVGFGKPGHDVAAIARMGAESVHRRGHPAAFYIADRGYFPNSVPEGLQIPVRKMGYDLVFDLREDQVGVNGGYEGSALIDGWHYCPAIPDPLKTVEDDFRKKRIDEATYVARRKQRAKYAFQRKEYPDKNGNERLMCPARGPNPTAKCPHVRRDDVVPSDTIVQIRLDEKPSSDANPEPFGKVCTQESVTVPLTACAKSYQPLVYKSEEWEVVYGARSGIEGFNGHAKDPIAQALGTAPLRRIRGYAAQYLLATISVLAMNLKKLLAFAEFRIECEEAEAAGEPRPPQPGRRNPHVGKKLPAIRRLLERSRPS